MRSATLLISAMLVMACRSRSNSLSHSQTSPGADETGRCQVPRNVGEAADCYAVRCAEDFVRRNGYTIDPPSGPQRRDPFDIPTEKRHGLLYGAAIVHRWVPAGHFVGFRYRDSSDNVGRAVLMTEGFKDMELDRLNLVWSPDSRLPSCGKDAG